MLLYCYYMITMYTLLWFASSIIRCSHFFWRLSLLDMQVKTCLMLQSSRGSRAMESMVEENGSAVDPLSQSSQSGDAAPAIATSVQSLDRTHQQQTHHLVASTSIVQLTLPSSGTTQVYRRLSCVSMSNNFFPLYFGACVQSFVYLPIMIIYKS